jgi:hypothetical protein
MQKIIFAIGAGVVLSTTYTMAQQGQIREECAADIRAACGDVAPGGIRSCLNSHLADLPGRAKPYWSRLQQLRMRAAATSVHCAEAWNLAAAELKLVCNLTSQNSAHPA